MNLHLVLLFVYSAFLVLVGGAIGRRVKTAGGFFVAGRNLGAGLLFATMLAANIGAGSTVGAAGLGYRDGASAWWWIGSAGIGTFVLAFWIGPRMWRLAKEHDLRTVGDYLEHRYGAAVRGTVSALLWLGTLAILAGQLIAMAWVLHAVAGIPKLTGCLLGGVVMTLYFSAGGLVSSAWVNLVQLVVLLTGFGVAVPLAIDVGGGWQTLSAIAPSADYWNFWSGGSSGWVYLPLLVPAFIISPGLIQKTYGARDLRALRLGVGLSGLALMIFAALPPLLGLVARGLHPELTNPELALPTLLVHDLPVTIGMLGLAAVFSAEISSADACLFMLATSLSQDLYRRFINPRASDRRILTVARLAALGGGFLGLILAILLPTVIDSLKIFYSLLGVSLFVPILAGLHTRRPGVAEALAAIGVGIAVLVVVRYGTGGFGIWNPNLLGLAASALAYAALWLGRRIRTQKAKNKL